MYRILSISYDSALLQTRQELLEQAGYEVLSAFGFAEAMEQCSGDFDLIVMGHSIPQDDKRAMIAELNRHGCNAPLLSLLRIGEAQFQKLRARNRPIPATPLKHCETMLYESSSN